MAQVVGFKAMGAVAIKKGDTLDHTKLPTGVTTVSLCLKSGKSGIGIYYPF